MDESSRRALQNVWAWMLSGVDPLEEFTTEQLTEMRDDLTRAAQAVQRHIVRRGDE